MRPYIVNNCWGREYCYLDKLIWLATGAINTVSKIRWNNNHQRLVWRLANPWWRHQMKTFSVLLALCAGNSPVTGEFPSQRPVTRSFDVFFDLRLNKRLSTHSRRRWFEASWRSLWLHCSATFRAWRSNYTHMKQWGVIIHPESVAVELEFN